MQSELTERAERLIDRELRKRNPIVRSHAIMKMCSTDRLRTSNSAAPKSRSRAWLSCRSYEPGISFDLAGWAPGFGFVYQPAA